MLDLYNRKLDYLRISIISSCNFRCEYCNPNGLLEDHGQVVSKEEIIEVVKLFAKLGIKKVRVTGGEPLLRKDLEEIIEGINRVEGIQEITMTTNGFKLAQRLEKLKKSGLTRVNISLDTLDRSKYKEITKVDGLDEVLKGIEKLEELKMTPIKVNCVLIKDFNINEIEEFIKLTKDREIQIRFIEVMKIGDNLEWGEGKYYNSEKILKRFPELNLVKCENVAKIYKYRDYKGEIGIISPNSNKFCSSCNRIRVTAKGRLKLCLHSDIELDLLEVVRGENSEEVLKKILTEKPEEHKLEEGKYIKRGMVSIGG